MDVPHQSPAGLASRLWPDPERGPWLIRATFARVDGRMEVVGLELRSVRRADRDPKTRELVDAEPHLAGVLPSQSWPHLEDSTGREPLPLRADVWRSVPVAQIASELRTAYVDVLEDSGALGAVDPRVRARWQGPSEDRAATLEDVAAVYLDALDAGKPPTKAVKDKLHLSKSAAAQRVARARAAGLLAPTRKGLPSGAPGGAGRRTAAESLTPDPDARPATTTRTDDTAR